MNKYIMLCMSMVFLQVTAQTTESMRPVESLPANFGLYFEQTVSIEIENFALEVASKIGFTPKITVVHPSNYAVETNPAFTLILVLQAPQILLSINKQWFTSLSEEERFFGIALQLMNIVPSKEAEDLEKKLDKTKKIVNGLLFATKAGVLGGTYYYIRNKDAIVLKKADQDVPAKAIRIDNWCRKLGVALAASLAFEIIVQDSIKYFINKYEQAQMKEIRLSKFESWIRKYSSIDVAISYIIKALKETNSDTINESLDFLSTLTK